MDFLPLPAPLVSPGETPLDDPQDRFPLGLPGRIVPVHDTPPSAVRPWGMDHARRPVPILTSKHEKPTTTKTEKVPTKHTNDSEEVPDDYTRTVTD